MSTLKTNTLDTPSGSGNITVNRPTILTAGDIITADLANDAVTEAKIVNNAVTLAKMAGGTDGQIITYDASGDPVAVGPGTDGQVLTSTGAGSPPAFEALAASGLVDSFVNASYNLATSAGTQSITGAGFTPSSAIMLYCKAGSATVGIGIAVGSTEGTICNEHHTATENWNVFGKFAMCVTGSATHTSCTVAMTSDGIDLTWGLSQSPSGTLQMKILFFK